jgi:hypothetical protein
MALATAYIVFVYTRFKGKADAHAEPECAASAPNSPKRVESFSACCTVTEFG